MKEGISVKPWWWRVEMRQCLIRLSEAHSTLLMGYQGRQIERISEVPIRHHRWPEMKMMVEGLFLDEGWPIVENTRTKLLPPCHVCVLSQLSMALAPF
jgi:hypothetical protein